MEFAIIPLVALGGLFMTSTQTTNKKENYENRSKLPNVDIQDKNYPSELIANAETDMTSKLSTVNKYDAQHAYTDKYFNPSLNQATTDSYIKSDDTQFYSMSGEKVGHDYFRHNNMVPFFGGNIRSRQVDANASESILDNHTGSGSQHFSKKEQAPLFAPNENQQWAHGAPNVTEFMRSRVNPSSRMANVKPFEEQQVAPGLGLGYTTGGSGGFNSGMMNREAWAEKTVDQLRIDTNPKASGNMILGYEGPANSHIKNRAQQGVQEKNRVDTSFAMSSDRYFTTTGLEKGQTMRAVHMDRDVARPETSASYAGVAGYGHSTIYVDGEHNPSTRIELGALPFSGASATGRANATESDYGIKTKMAYPNNRTQNVQDKYFGAVGGAFGAAVAPLLDALRPSRKENTIGNLRLYQNAKSRVSAPYMYDPKDAPQPTIREMTENSKGHMYINANQRGGGYEVSDHQVANTARNSTGDFYYAGGSSATNAKSMRSFDAERNQRNNDIKSSTIQGRTGNGNMNLYSGTVNMSAKHKDERLINTRQVVPKGVAQSPSINTMGRMTGAEPLYQSMQLDRTNINVNEIVKGNPYAIPYGGALM
jgi:hypothetical protein